MLGMEGRACTSVINVITKALPWLIYNITYELNMKGSRSRVIDVITKLQVRGTSGNILRPCMKVSSTHVINVNIKLPINVTCRPILDLNTKASPTLVITAASRPPPQTI